MREALAAPLESAEPKLKAAREAIAARLHSSPLPDVFETLAIEEALKALQALDAVVDAARTRKAEN